MTKSVFIFALITTSVCYGAQKLPILSQKYLGLQTSPNARGSAITPRTPPQKAARIAQPKPLKIENKQSLNAAVARGLNDLSDIEILQILYNELPKINQRLAKLEREISTPEEQPQKPAQKKRMARDFNRSRAIL